jgi:hypothetical protein
VSGKKRDYVLMERVGLKGPDLNGFDIWLCPWSDWSGVLTAALEDLPSGTPYTVRITVLNMTDAEREAYCEEHDIEWD